MKELPATLVMRPFDFDTLAVQAYNLAADERLTEAATAALAIVAVGILPVILLSKTIAKSRPGGVGRGDVEARGLLARVETASVGVGLRGASGRRVEAYRSLGWEQERTPMDFSSTDRF